MSIDTDASSRDLSATEVITHIAQEAVTKVKKVFDSRVYQDLSLMDQFGQLLGKIYVNGRSLLGWIGDKITDVVKSGLKYFSNGMQKASYIECAVSCLWLIMTLMEGYDNSSSFEENLQVVASNNRTMVLTTVISVLTNFVIAGHRIRGNILNIVANLMSRYF